LSRRDPAGINVPIPSSGQDLFEKLKLRMNIYVLSEVSACNNKIWGANSHDLKS
jgi:hypothetical protein